jgi:hypothetical protein
MLQIQVTLLPGDERAAPVEGAWPYAPVIEALCGLRQQDPALLGRLAGRHRAEIDRARPSSGSARSATATPRRSSAATSPNPSPSWSGWSPRSAGVCRSR